MHQYDSFFTAMFDKCRRAPVFAAALVTAVLLAGGALAQSSAQGPVKLLGTVAIPPAKSNTTGGLYAYDISYVDPLTQTYYLGDRSNRGVDVVDASTGTY